MIKKFLKDERGFLSTYIWTFGFVFIVLFVLIFASLFMSIDTKGMETYNWFKAGLDYAAYMANVDGNTSMVASRESTAKQYFMASFAKMTDCTVSGNTFYPTNSRYPGPIVLTEFRTILPGQSIPHGITLAPGYMATVNVPLFGGNFPLVGYRYVTYPMKYYSVVRLKSE